MNDKGLRWWLGVACALIVATAARSEDVEKRWRLGLGIGLADTGSGVQSDAANVLRITDFDNILVDLFVDPRNDSGQQVTLQIETRNVVMLSAQYAATKMFLVDISGGYTKGDVGDLEMQAQFTGVAIDPDERFNFAIFEIPCGELETIPLNVTAIARFRPRASFNPYVGIGLGYTWIGFTPSDELNDISRNMDLSVGQFAFLESFPGALVPTGPVLNLEGVTASVENSWNWHLSGGVEYTFMRKWATYLDLTYNFASQSMLLTFDPPTPSVGISVPDKRVFFTEPEATATYGAVSVVDGGFIDGGQLVPLPEAPEGTNCTVSPNACEFVVGDLDGVPDPGMYYIQSGALQYDDWVLTLGIRYTF